MLKFRVKGQLGSDLCIITQILSALLTTPPPSCNRRVLIKCPFLSQNSNFHTILLTKLIPYSDHKKSVRNWCFFPVFNCLTHFAKFERCWTMKSSKRLLYLLRINKQLFVVNHVFSIKTMFPHNLVKKSAQPSSQNPNLWWLVFNKHFSTILISSLSSSFRNDRVLLYLYPFKYFRNK